MHDSGSSHYTRLIRITSNLYWRKDFHQKRYWACFQFLFFFPRILCYFSFFFFIFQFYVGSINLQFYTIYSPLMYEFKFFEHSCASCHAIVLIFIFHYEFILSLTWSPVWSPMLCVSNIALPFLLVFIRIRDIVPCSQSIVRSSTSIHLKKKKAALHLNLVRTLELNLNIIIS